ncbi:hypothetical protein AAFF_G00140560 [Aldrovandia affinis]|uniref:Uncharacterized protein n=1 Tax=Aldrovandia affinis TaxID=143900 RepID=A0AAD7X2R7_9TELE|nr:hypothetical protein AAFF_G00140560 [Aldrovandia affinis]
MSRERCAEENRVSSPRPSHFKGKETNTTRELSISEPRTLTNTMNTKPRATPNRLLDTRMNKGTVARCHRVSKAVARRLGWACIQGLFVAPMIYADVDEVPRALEAELNKPSGVEQST